MRSEAEVMKVQEAIAKADPHHEDEMLEIMNDTLRWAMGWDDSSADEFIAMNIEEL